MRNGNVGVSELLPTIPADQAFNSEELSADQIAAAIEATITFVS